MLLLAGIFRRLIFVEWHVPEAIFNLIVDGKCRRLIFSLIIFNLILDGKCRRLTFSLIIFNLILDVKCRRLIFSLIIFMLILDGKLRRLIFDDHVGQRLQRPRRLWWLWWR